MRRNDIIEESFNTSRDRKSLKSNRTFWTGLLVVVLLFIGVISTGMLLQSQQDVRQQAETNLNACGQPGGFCETFDGNPATPQPLGGIAGKYIYPNWMFAVHSRDQSTWQTLETQDNVMHGADCSAPPAFHTNNTYEGAVFNCKNHIMTAMLAGGYGLIALTPNAMVDFSTGPAIIQWEMSTHRMSTRDWPDVWITPWADATILPYDAGDVDMQGPVKNAIHVNAQSNQNGWQVFDIQDGVNTDLGSAFWVSMNEGIVDGTNQDAVRQTFRITISQNHIKMERLASATATQFTWLDTDIPNLNFNKGVVQFAHHIYNPYKDGAGVAATWHWDTIAINPSIPFTIIHADKRNVSTDGEVVTFDSPAPANSLLKFAGAGGITYSLNGTSYQTAPKQLFANHFEHFSPYSFPIPEGTDKVSFNFGPDDWYNCGWGCQAEDFAIWSLTSPTGGITPIATNTPAPSVTIIQQPTPTNTPVPTNTPIPTVAVNTPTPPNTPTPTGAPIATSTPTAPTNTPIPPTATPTPVPCALSTASWSTSNTTQGQTVTLNVTGNSSCNGKTVSFAVVKNGFLLGLGDSPANINPTNATMNNGIATTSWTAEWQDNGLLGGDPQYYFNATIGNSTIRSVDPLLTVTQATQQTQVVQSGNRINYLGKNFYLQGANVPWYNWACDFGCNSNGGVSNNQTTLSTAFARMKNANMHVARWWVFPGDPWQITRDGSGAPSGLNSSIYADFDAALALADQYDLYYDFVLFSGATAPPRSWLTDATQRQQLAQVLAPLFARYKDNPRVMTWEIFNEPEFQIWNNEIDETSVVETGKAITDSVHNNSHALVTVGNAMMDGMAMWANVNLDYYSPHWYDYMQPGNWCAICQTTAQARSTWPTIGNKPIVVGEAYVGSDVNPLARYNTFYDNGYAGVWGWSLFPDRTSDHLAIDQTAAVTFGQSKTDLGPSSNGITPTSTPTQPTPTIAPPTPTPTPIPCTVSSASWSQAGPVDAGTPVGINVTTIGDCAGKQVAFTVMENDSILEGLIDDPVNISPQPAAISNNHATATWIAEYQEDGVGGMFDPPEYYVNVSVVGDNNITRSADPLLEVNKVVTPPPPPTPTPIPTITVFPTNAPTPTSLPTPTGIIPSATPIVSNGTWTGQYYQYAKGNKTFGLNGTPVLTRIDPIINFNWGSGSPAANIKSDRFSIRWTSSPSLSAGTYQFKTTSDDGMRVYLDGRLLSGISIWSNHSAITKTQNVAVTQGVHQIVVEFYENTGQAVAKFFYTKL